VGEGPAGDLRDRLTIATPASAAAAAATDVGSGAIDPTSPAKFVGVAAATPVSRFSECTPSSGSVPAVKSSSVSGAALMRTASTVATGIDDAGIR